MIHRPCRLRWPWPKASACCPARPALAAARLPAGVVRRRLADQPARQPAAPSRSAPAVYAGKLPRPTGRRWWSCSARPRPWKRQPADFGKLLDFLDRLLMSLAALSGFALDDITRDDGWRFLMIGRCIERLQFLCESVAGLLAAPRHGPVGAGSGYSSWATASSPTAPATWPAPQLDPGARPAAARRAEPACRAVPAAPVAAFAGASWGRASTSAPAPPWVSWRATPPPSAWAAWRARCSAAPGSARCSAAWPTCCCQIAEVSGRVSDQLALRFFVHVDASQRTQSLMKRALYRVLHDTHYRYSAPVSLAQQLAHLWPRRLPPAAVPGPRADRHPAADRAPGRPRYVRQSADPPGLRAPTRQLRVIASLRVEVLARDSLVLDDSPAWENVVAALGYSGQPLAAGIAGGRALPLPVALRAPQAPVRRLRRRLLRARPAAAAWRRSC